MTPLDRLKHHVSGAIERGEAAPIKEKRAHFTLPNMTPREAILWDALRRIASLDEKSCERYVAKADSIAIDAMVSAEMLEDTES